MSKKRTVKKAGIIFNLIMAFAFIVSIALLSGCYTKDEASNYLNQFDRATNVAVTDIWQDFCYENETLDLRKQFKLDNFNRIGFVDKDSIYIICYNKQYIIYKSNYDLTEINKIFEFSAVNGSFRFLESDLFCYEFNGVSYVHKFSSETTEVVENSYIENYFKEVNKYSVSRKINAFSSATTKFFITDNSTGEEKTITKDDFLKTEQGKYLNEKKSFSLFQIYAKCDDVFVIARTNGICVIFKYDFESNSVQYYSWIDDSKLYSEPRNFYFF